MVIEPAASRALIVNVERIEETPELVKGKVEKVGKKWDGPAIGTWVLVQTQAGQSLASKQRIVENKDVVGEIT